MSTWSAGPRNHLTDVAGLAVGHHQRTGDGWLTGTTVVLAPPDGAVGGADVRGGGPGTRETDLLDPRNMVERVHAVVLSGGSAFGLGSADGVMRTLYAEQRGLQMGQPGQVVPIVPGAVVFDLGRGGNFSATPDAAFGENACRAAILGESGEADEGLRLGSVGAGTGTQAGGLRGGIGSASAVLETECGAVTIAALVVVNAVGSTVDPETGELWGARHLIEADVNGIPGWPEGRMPGLPDQADLEAARQAAQEANATSAVPRTLATTIGVVATDATLTESQCARIAGSGHDGMARAINPIHTMFDGDTLFGLSTHTAPAPDAFAFHQLLHAAGEVVTRSIVRAMLAAETVGTPAGTWRCYRDAFPSAVG
ncbi:P1 family peptidase [Ornithinimicrobium panacihumi]|uniref:P1 family peptidase n=1 Tax=Ornithinimicrobium panacihumi TaxID=2008449 RepID=UPI003F88F42E